MTDQSQIPSGAQLKREMDIRMQAVKDYSGQLNLRVKSVELAAAFGTNDAIKLINEIYEFLSKDAL